MSTEEQTKKQVNLQTSDNAEITVDREVAERSILIKNLLEDLGGDNDEAIPIPNVRAQRCAVFHVQANHLSRSTRRS